MLFDLFWAEQGCVVQQPYDVEVGAGTMNPATALRVLGPEPWRMAYAIDLLYSLRLSLSMYLIMAGSLAEQRAAVQAVANRVSDGAFE